MSDDDICLSVVTQDPDGRGYVCALYFGGQRLRTLPPDVAAAYCAELIRAITTAEHEAAILAQLDDMGLPMNLRAQTIRDLRADRRPMIEAATAPIVYAPIVSHKTLKGMINGSVGAGSGGEPVEWQWDLDTARQHVMYVMEVSAGADMDSSYRDHLTGIVGLSKVDASRYVTLLRNYMPSTTHRHTDGAGPPA